MVAWRLACWPGQGTYGPVQVHIVLYETRARHLGPGDGPGDGGAPRGAAGGFTKRLRCGEAVGTGMASRRLAPSRLSCGTKLIQICRQIRAAGWCA